MSKGGSTTSQVQIPQYLEDAARRNLSRASQISNIGYTPYYGADVAAMTPMQQAAMQGTNQMASAFGLPSVSNPMAGMPQSQDFGGMQAYSSAPMYEQSLQSLAQNRPEQYQAIESMFNPTGGTSYGGGYGSGGGSGGGYGTTNSGGGVSASDVAGTALGAYGAYKVLPAVASKVGGLLGGTSGIGALPTLSQVGAVAPYLGAPFLLDPIGKHVISPIAKSLGFGSAERERKAEATKALQDSGFFATKDAIKSLTGKSQEQYLQEAQEVLTQNPYKRSIQGLPDTDDGRLEAEAMSRYYSEDPRGKAEMASYYAKNPDFFTPEGDRLFPDDPYGDMQRAAAEYNATSPYAQGGIGISPALKVAEMAKNNTLKSMRNRETFNTAIRSGIGTPGASTALTGDDLEPQYYNRGLL